MTKRKTKQNKTKENKRAKEEKKERKLLIEQEEFLVFAKKIICTRHSASQGAQMTTHTWADYL